MTLEAIFDAMEKFITFIPKMIWWFIRLVGFILMSILVVPAMLIMLTLHKPWEKMIDGVFSLNPF